MTTDLSGPALQAAPHLLGAALTSHVGGEEIRVRITEVEAYEGERDPGSHAYRGRSPRNEVMFGPAGHLYVYTHLGLHHCVNLVCGPVGQASAVLLRGAQVLDGVEVAWRRRLAGGVCRREVDLARGPARLAVVLGLDRGHNGVEVASVREREALVTLEAAAAAEPISTGPRVGVNGPGGDGRDYPWRFWLADDPHVSAFRAGKVSTGK